MSTAMRITSKMANTKVDDRGFIVHRRTLKRTQQVIFGWGYSANGTVVLFRLLIATSVDDFSSYILLRRTQSYISHSFFKRKYIQYFFPEKSALVTLLLSSSSGQMDK